MCMILAALRPTYAVAREAGMGTWTLTSVMPCQPNTSTGRGLNQHHRGQDPCLGLSRCRLSTVVVKTFINFVFLKV